MTDAMSGDERNRLRAEYVRQIREAPDADVALILVEEYGARAYYEGWNHAMRTVKAFADERSVAAPASAIS